MMRVNCDSILVWLRRFSLGNYRQLVILCAVLPAIGADAPVKVKPRSLAETRSSIRVTSQRVVVPVTVLNASGALVNGLSRERFRLFDDGVEQTVLSFGQEDSPVSIGIVFDASRSMESKLARARDAVRSLLMDSLPHDEFHLVEFNDSPRLLCELTSNTADLQRALGGVKAQGWTALFDGIMMGAQKMRRAGNSRRALVILSDGADNFSRYQESEVKAYLREAGVVVFAITLTGSAPPTHQTHHLRALARETGGWAYSIGNLEKMTEAVRAIGVAIRTQYMLTYAPTNGKSDGKLHRIAVQLAPKDPGFAASWRSSYYAVDLR